jgi:hypothetical protein
MGVFLSVYPVETFYEPFFFFLILFFLTLFAENFNFFSLLTELRALDLQTGYFTLRQIKAATSNFDPANKIGEGGFGPVYKVIMDYWFLALVSVTTCKAFAMSPV